MESSNIVWYTIYGLPLLLIGRVLVQIFTTTVLSPLRKIPGPWWASITGLPTRIAILSKQQVHFYHDMHRKYGPFVRTGPDEVIISDLATCKEIHRIGTPFLKSDFYHYLNPTPEGKGPYAVFSETDPARHARHRKLLGRGFTQQSLRTTWEDVVRDKVSHAVEWIKSECAKDGDVDILKWWMFMTADVTSHLMFGESFDTLKTGHKIEWFNAVPESTSMSACCYHFPWLYYTLKYLPVPSVQRMISAPTKLYAQGQSAAKNSRSASSTKNIFTNVLAQAEKNDGTMTDEEVVIEAGSFIIAGTDTTSTTLTYLIYCVLSDPDLQKLLEDEVARVEEPLTDTSLETLSVLNAVIKETLRLYGAAPGPLLRVVPTAGATLGGYNIPGGTIISSQAWTLHRDPANFPDPDRFDHSRWLSSAVETEEAKMAFMPFGAGSRICIGLHLAYMELRLGTAMFFRQCRGARLAASTTPESMEVENIALIEPKGKQCRVIVPVS